MSLSISACLSYPFHLLPFSTCIVLPTASSFLSCSLSLYSFLRATDKSVHTITITCQDQSNRQRKR